VLVLSAKSDASVKVRALELGADDYLTKPFWPEELVARVQARLRRPVLARADRLDVGPITIDVLARRVIVDGRDVELTRVEYDLLTALARRADAAVTRAWIVENVLDPEREGGERTLDVHVSRLRKKLGAHGALVTTVWGVGYRLTSGAST
jgi:DNA-binding response OmpR family regulator